MLRLRSREARISLVRLIETGGAIEGAAPSVSAEVRRNAFVVWLHIPQRVAMVLALPAGCAPTVADQLDRRILAAASAYLAAHRCDATVLPDSRRRWRCAMCTSTSSNPDRNAAANVPQQWGGERFLPARSQNSSTRVAVP